jgi:hypothetical protein
MPSPAISNEECGYLDTARTLALVLVKRIWISRNLDEWLSASESPSELRIEQCRTSYFSIAINMNEHPATTTSPSPPTSAPATRAHFHHARPRPLTSTPAPTRSKFQKRAPEARKYYWAHVVVLYCLWVLTNQTFPLTLPRLQYDQAGKEQPTSRPRIRGKGAPLSAAGVLGRSSFLVVGPLLQINPAEPASSGGRPFSRPAARPPDRLAGPCARHPGHQGAQKCAVQPHIQSKQGAPPGGTHEKRSG